MPGSKRGARASPLSTTTRTPVDGQRRLGDVGRQHDAPPARRRRRQRLVLLLEGQRAGQAVDVDVGTEVADELLGEPGDLADAGQERQHVAVLVAQRPADGARHRRPPAGRRATAAASGRRRGTSGPALSTTGAGPSAVASRRANSAVSAVADIAAMRRSGRSVAAASSVNASPRSVVRLRSWTSSKMHEPDAGQLGILLQAAGQHALGQHLDPGRRADAPLVAGLVADEVADGRCR